MSNQPITQHLAKKKSILNARGSREKKEKKNHPEPECKKPFTENKSLQEIFKRFKISHSSYQNNNFKNISERINQSSGRLA
jgi:hypothetical protein